MKPCICDLKHAPQSTGLLGMKIVLCDCECHGGFEFVPTDPGYHRILAEERERRFRYYQGQQWRDPNVIDVEVVRSELVPRQPPTKLLTSATTPTNLPSDVPTEDQEGPDVAPEDRARRG